MATQIEVRPLIGDDNKTLTVHLSGRRRPIVCQALGVETDAEGSVIKIWADTLLHRPLSDEVYTGWEMKGAVSTILSKPHNPSNEDKK